MKNCGWKISIQTNKWSDTELTMILMLKLTVSSKEEEVLEEVLVAELA